MASLISIIVPCFNQAQYLNECLQSVFDQTYTNWECIIINDGSYDNTNEIAKNWVLKDTRFVYLNKENSGICDTRNKGIEVAKGKYILPLDADDKISENYIETCINEFIINPNTQLVYANAKKFGVVNIDWNLPKFDYQNLLDFNMIYCSAVFKKTDWQKIGGYDQNMKQGFEDWEFWIRLLNNNSKVVKCNNAYFYYRIKENSRTTNLNQDLNLKTNLKKYIYFKHKEKYSKLNEFELFEENKILKNKLENLYFSQSYFKLLLALFKKVYHKLRKLFQ